MGAGINPWPVDFNQPQPEAAPYQPPMTPYNIPQIDPGQYAYTSGAYSPNQLGGTYPRPTTMPQATAQDIAGTTTAMGPRTPEGTWNQMYKIGMAESGMRNIPTGILDPRTGQPASTASGYWQITDPTWKDGQDYAGIPEDQRTARAMDASYAQQKKVAYALYQQRGTTPWVSSQHVWGSGKYTDLQVPDEDTYDPSLGQIAQLGKHIASTGQTNGLQGQGQQVLDPSQYAASPEEQAAQHKQLQNLMLMAMMRGWHLQPVDYDPAKVLRAGRTYEVDPLRVQGLPHMTEATQIQPTRPITAIAPQMVPGRLGQKGPPEPGG